MSAKKRKIKPSFRLKVLAMKDEKIKLVCQALINAMDSMKNADDRLWTDGVSVSLLTNPEISEVQKIFIENGFMSVVVGDSINKQIHIMFDRVDVNSDFINKMIK